MAKKKKNRPVSYIEAEKKLGHIVSSYEEAEESYKKRQDDKRRRGEEKRTSVFDQKPWEEENSEDSITKEQIFKALNSQNKPGLQKYNPAKKYDITVEQMAQKRNTPIIPIAKTETEEKKKIGIQLSDEQLDKKWNEYFNKQYAPKQTDKWKTMTQDLQYGYDGIYNPQKQENYDIVTADGDIIPFNAYAIKQAGIPATKTKKLADALYDQYVERRSQPQQTQASEIKYSGWAQPMSQETKDALKLSAARQSIDQEEIDKRNGRYNGTGDYWKYNKEGLAKEYANYWGQYVTNTAGLALNKAQKDAAKKWKPEDAYAGAEELYDTLENSGLVLLNGGRDEARMNAANFYQTKVLQSSKPQDEESRQAAREMLFNEIYGNTSGYQYSYLEGSGYKEEVDRQLDQMLDQMYGKYTGEVWQSATGAEMKQRYAKEKMDVLGNQMEWNQKYEELMKGAKAEGFTDTSFHPELENADQSVFERGFKAWAAGPRGDNHEEDDLYSFINGGKSYQYVMSHGDKITDNPLYKNAQMMSSDEVAIFNGYYNSGRKEDAIAFYHGLETMLTQRYRYYEEIMQRDAANRLPVLATMRTFVDTMAQTGEFAGFLLGNALGDEQVKNPYGRYFDATRDKTYTRSYIGENLGAVGKFAYDTFTSAGDSAINMLMAGGRGSGLSKRAMQAVTLSFFGTQAFQTSMEQNLMESHGNYNASLAAAAVDTMIEIGTEIWSVENLLSDPSNFLKYIAKTSFSEGSEELVGATLGPYIKEMLLHKNEWKQRADQIYNEGGYWKDGQWIKVDNPEDATRQAMKEWNHDIFISTASGALSTGGSVFYGGAQNINNRMQMGRQIQNEQNTQKGVSGLRQIVDLGTKMEDGGKSHDMALKMQQDMDAGKKVSNYQAGQLAQTIMEETGEKQNDVIRETMERDVQKQLEDTGVDRGQAREYAGLIARDLLGGEKLSISERHKLSKDSRAIDVWKSFYTNPALVNQAESNISTATEETRKTMRSVSDLLSDRNAATSTVAAEVTRSIRETKSDAEAIDNLQQRRGDILSSEYAQEMKTVLQEDEQAQKSKSFVDDAMKIRMAVMSQSETMPETNLSQETATRLQEAAQKEWDAGEKLRIENNRQLKVTPGKGTAVIAERQADGSFKTLSEYGKDGFQQQLKDMGLSKKTRNRATVISEVAKRMGMNARFINEEQNKNIHGYEIQQTGEVVINLASDMKHHMLVTLSHEMTHWLEQNSNEAYKELRKYVLNNLRAKGENVEQLLLKAMDNQRMARITQEMNNNGKSNIQDLSLNDAMFEIVAKSCENLLSSKEFEQELARSNPTLHGKIVQAVREFMGRLKSAIEGMDKSLSHEAQMLYNETEEIAKIWLKGYHEATGQEQTEESDMPDWSQETDKSEEMPDWSEETDKSEEMPDWSEEGIYQPAEGVKLSVEDTSYMKAINSGNIEAANRIVRAIAKTKGYIERAFHGTNAFGFTEVDMNESQGQFFVAYNLDLAGTYTHMQSLKNISENKIETMSNKELARLAEAVSIEAEEGVTAVRYNEKTGLFEADMDIGETAAYTKEEIQAMLNDYIEYDQTVEEGEKSNALKTMKQGIYDLYLNPGKQLVIDAEGRSWRNIPFNLEDYGTSWEQEFGSMPKPGGWTTRTIAEWAKRAGYDSVRINNVVDNGNQSSYKGGGDIGIFFNENAIKSADTVTVDDEGNVIPPSERFNAEKTDVRYSIEQLDDGTNYVEVNTDQDIFKGMKPKEMLKKANDIIKQRFVGKTISYADGEAVVDNKTAGEYAYPRQRKMKESVKRAKAKVSTELDNLVEIGTKINPGDPDYPAYHGHELNQNTTGFDYYKSLFRVNGRFFTGIVNIEHKKGYDRIKDVTQIKEDTSRNMVTNQGPIAAQSAVGAASAINNYTQNKNNGKQIYSVEEMDWEYDQAVKSGNVELQQQLVDQAAERAMPSSRIRGKDGKLLRMYHGTNAEFNEFRRDMIGSTGRFEGSGFNFTPYEGRAKSYGKNVYSGYLDIQNPLSAEKKTISVSNLAKLIRQADPTGDNIIADYARETRDYGQPSFVQREALTAARNLWESSDNDVDIYSYISAADSDAESLIKVFSQLGYDGLIHYDSEGNIKTAVAFSSEQFKRADPVTYDNGKEIKLSERFDMSNPDIRYSVEEMDRAYDQAVKSGNVELQQYYVNEAAERARYTDTVYHGTEMFGFTRFDLKAGRDTIFVSYNKKLASSYERTGEVRQIKDRNGVPVNHYTLNTDELIKYAKKAMPYYSGGKVLDIKYNEKNGVKGFDITYENSWTKEAKTTFARDFELHEFLDEYQNPNGEYDGIYEMFAKPGKQLVINAEGHDWNDIPFDLYGTKIGGTIDEETIEYTDTAWDEDFDPEVPHDITASTRKIAAWAKAHGYDSVRINNLYDNGGRNWQVDYQDSLGDIGIFFNESDVKSADPVTYDDAGNVIPLSERFNAEEKDIRYSVQEGEEPQEIYNDQGESMATILPGNTIAATRYSLSSYYDLNERGKMIKALEKAGYTEKQITKWIRSLDNVAAKIASDRTMYDYTADRTFKFLKPNGDVYKKTIDANTMCKKTRLYNGVYNLVQHMLPNTVLMPEDLINLYNMMKDEGLETPCKFCYVQSRRRHLGSYTDEWLKEYKGEYIPRVEEVTTSDGLEKLKVEHPQTYKDFVKAMNKKGVNNPKLVQQRTDYRGEIRRMKASTVKYLNDIGGLRIQSFSDFEVVHMLDMMQVVMDMKAKGLAGQAYTKVPEFAWIFGKTGIKINLSLVGRGTGLNSKGELVFDNEEGINFDEAMALRKAYSKNVGTIIVGINDEHIIACMGDDRIDFIIPFHKSGWSENELKNMRGLDHYSDYTDSQNEYNLVIENGKVVDRVKADSNIDPLSYWEFKQNGQYNAEKYLAQCAKNHIQPKFSQFLVDNGNGTWSLPQGTDQRSTNIREGYWKTLIDFKMYDNDGNGAAQQKVQPNFNMEAADRILNAYDGSHRVLPENEEVANKYVEQYKKDHPLDNVRTMYSVDESPDMDVNRFMLGLNELHMPTYQEQAMVRQYKELRGAIDMIEFRIGERQKIIDAIMAKGDKKSAFDKKQLEDKIRLQNYDRDRVAEKKRDLAKVTGKKGYAGIMFKNARLMGDLVTNRTAEELNSTVRAMSSELASVEKEMTARREAIASLAESEGVLAAKTQFNRAGLKQIASRLKDQLNTSVSEDVIANHLALIALKMKQGQYDKETTEELVDLIIGKMRSGYDSYVIDTLRGRTITLSASQLKELEAKNSSLSDVRKDLAGTGIRIQSKGGVTLDSVWEELCDMIPSLDREASDLAMLDKIVDLVKSEKRIALQQRMSDENLMGVTQTVLEAARDLMPEIVTDKKSLALIRDVLEYVKDVSAQAKGTAEGLGDIENMVKNLQKRAVNVGNQAIHLGNNINDAIDYFNQLGEQSEAALWKRERAALIAQLKSENTQNILAEQQKWKDRIAKDREARGMQESNLQLRKKITTNYSRIRKLIINETDRQNIPEHMKGLARAMLIRITNNDLVNRKITGVAKEDLYETKRVLDIMQQMDGEFSIDDLKLIGDEEAQAAVADALADLEDGIGFYNASPSGNLLTNLQGYQNSLNRINEAVATIVGVINAQRNISFRDRQISVADAAEDIRHDMNKSRYKGEYIGRGRKAANALNKTVVYGNTTPIYFIKNLLNRGMSEQWHEVELGENDKGLEIKKAQNYMGALAEKTGYKEWADQRMDVTLGGKKVNVSIGNIMELFAIWNREQTLNPEMSQHLTKGGIYIQNDNMDEGTLRRERQSQRAIRVTDEEILEAYSKLTDEQKEYLQSVVSYLSNEMSDLGNAASMRMYGIKKYKETYYFPMKVWDGVKSARSDRGISGVDENRAAHRSWSKRRRHMASNALVIGDFTADAVNHIVEMINYNTMAPAIENLNKVLNYQFVEGTNEDDMTKRNMRVLFQEVYGKEALNYLETLMMDINGGMVQDQRKMLRDRMISTFKKSAVAGSLSVALQQPLSYIRAAMMINPKYLAAALNPVYYKGSLKEMAKYSGVWIIKDMGKFDMNMGQSAKDYIAPDKKTKLYNTISDYMTILPQKMDQMTWTRMWSAVKMEQHALNPDMNITSDEFLKKVAERFNDMVRHTQVYDSVLVKSSNMRSKNYVAKLTTSFMAEPTLTLNVLADAVRNAKQKGGMANLAKAGATYILSAICQSVMKALVTTGRNPDKDKTWVENFLNRFWYNFISEADPLSLIPGFNDLVEVLKTGKLSDDAMGVLGKIFDASTKTIGWIGSIVKGESTDFYRNVEDTAGQFAQLFTNIPLKNIMRDVRAVYTWFMPDSYANRDTSAAVLRYQAEATYMTANSLLGAVNRWLDEAGIGFNTENKTYYERIYNAQKIGNDNEAEEIREYLTLGKGVKDKTIDDSLRTQTKEDDSLSYSERIEQLRSMGATDKSISDWIVKEYEKGNLTKAEAAKLYQQANPAKDKEDAYFYFEQKEWETKTGNDVGTSDYFRLDDAIERGNAADYKAAEKELLAHGYNQDQISDHAKKQVTGKYKEGTVTRKEAEKQLKQYSPDMTDDDIFWTLDRIDYQKQTKSEKAPTGYYYRLEDAVNANKAEQINKEVKTLLAHGVTKEKIKNKLSDWKKDYLAADNAGRLKIRDAVTKAYKAAGYTAADADETIKRWIKDGQKKKN